MSFSPTLLPGYVSRDGKIIILARAVRGLSQSYVAVLLALYLNLLGFSVIQIGAFLSIGVAGGAVFAFVVARFSERVGRRRLFIVFSLVAAPVGLALFFTDNFFLLAFFCLPRQHGRRRAKRSSSASGAGDTAGYSAGREAHWPFRCLWNRR